MPYGVRLRELGDRDAWTCWVCTGEVDPSAVSGSPHAASVDHVVPRARGGTNAPTNLRLAHRRCNGQRGSRLPELDWPDSLGVLDPAPLWSVVQRARRRPGDWEVVATVSAEDTVVVREWLADVLPLVVGGQWETRVQPFGGRLATVALRAPAEAHGPKHRGNQRGGSHHRGSQRRRRP
jgi:hypothetical protein